MEIPQPPMQGEEEKFGLDQQLTLAEVIERESTANPSVAERRRNEAVINLLNKLERATPSSPNEQIELDLLMTLRILYELDGSECSPRESLSTIDSALTILVRTLSRIVNRKDEFKEASNSVKTSDR